MITYPIMLRFKSTLPKCVGNQRTQSGKHPTSLSGRLPRCPTKADSSGRARLLELARGHLAKNSLIFTKFLARKIRQESIPMTPRVLLERVTIQISCDNSNKCIQERDLATILFRKAPTMIALKNKQK